MDLRLLNNLPIENLTKENDYLGIIEKGDLIEMFLKENREQFSEIKMFALYGEWGSGKSTLMKYLQKRLKQNFNTFFFDTWEFENDNNLSLSLLEFLISETTSAGEEMAGELIGVAEKLLKGFTKSVRISFPGLSIDGKTLTEELESEKEKTFLQLKKEFKTEFVCFEDKIKAQTKKEYNIIFIDDLDRCEPENVLNFLSALKLFFTYGQKTIFLCGVDKKAVREAIRTKYNDVVKAEEYLEKIFDISFIVPNASSFRPLINYFFGSSEINLGSKNANIDEEISNFFGIIGFTNPRKVKKILNKYLILVNLKKNHGQGDDILILPNFYFGDITRANFLETILTLYILILHEFYHSKFNNIFNPEKKVVSYKKAVEARYKGSSGGDLHNQQSDATRFIKKAFLNTSLYELANVNFGNQQQREEATEKVAKLFSPLEVDYMDSGCFKRSDLFQTQFNSKERGIDYYFTEYLLKNINNLFFESKSLSGFKISDFEYLNERYL